MTDKVKVPEVTDELRQYWKERSEEFSEITKQESMMRITKQ